VDRARARAVSRERRHRQARRDRLASPPSEKVWAPVTQSHRREAFQRVKKDSMRVLAVFAHPDDETYGPGGTLAKLAAEGAEVRLITLTRGESATMGDSPLYSPELLADVRTKELDCACRALGISSHKIFGFPDRALKSVPSGELAAPITETLDRFKPHLVITFDPEGISGHKDHRTVSRIVTDLVRASCKAAGSQASGPGAPPNPRLVYYVIPKSIGAMVKWRHLFTVPDDKVTHVLEVGKYFEAKCAAAECHKTQRYMIERLNGVPGGLREMWRREYLVVDGEPRREPPEIELYHDG
jgi:LmbE family N-acetylglucosaminyl deacetylase